MRFSLPARRIARALPAPVRRQVWTVRRRIARRVRGAPFTEQLVDRLCIGTGIEVGPGVMPYGSRQRTLMVDRFLTRFGQTLATDVAADGDALPIRDHSRDYLISAHMLEHHRDPLAVLKEWTRVLRPGEYCFWSCHIAIAPSTRGGESRLSIISEPSTVETGRRVAR